MPTRSTFAPSCQKCPEPSSTMLLSPGAPGWRWKAEELPMIAWFHVVFGPLGRAAATLAPPGGDVGNAEPALARARQLAQH